MSCFGFGSHEPDEERGNEREPLLAQYEDDTSLQRALHQKLHTYQMLRALSQGFMPSTEQAVVNLRTILAADILNPEAEGLSDSGRALAHYLKQWISQLIEFLQHKNSQDQIQDFVWYLSKSRLSLDVDRIAQRASKAKAKTNAFAAYESVRTVGSLLLANSDVRLFASDLFIFGREILKDTADTLAEVSHEAGKRLEPSDEERAAVKNPGESSNGDLVTRQDLSEEAAGITEVVKDGAAKIAETAEDSFLSKMQGDEKQTLLLRLKQAVSKLRQRQDYTESVSTLTELLQRYLTTYVHAVGDAVQIADDINRNPETDRAGQNFYALIKSFGDSREWEELECRLSHVVKQSQDDPDFHALVKHVGNSIQEMLTDPAFFDDAESRFQDLRKKSREISSASPLGEEIDGLLAQAHTTFKSVMNDKHVANLINTTTILTKVLAPGGHHNPELITDATSIFLPQAARLLKFLPIPRIEISTPKIDLLLENLILEPGRAINDSSFLPYKLRIETYNDVELRKARFRTTSSVRTIIRIKMQGISVRADEVGFWFRARPGLFRFADEGIASFSLDERGIDVEMDIEIGRDRLEQVVSLRDVRVRIHKLNWTLRQSKFSFWTWLFKPLLKPLLKKTLQDQIAASMKSALHAANRELVYARERLRAARISNPGDVITFVRAVAARLVLEDNPDLYARVGVTQPGEGVFEGVYAPGSVVKVWNEEAAQAKQRIREYERDGWRNNVFNVHVTMLG